MGKICCTNGYVSGDLLYFWRPPRTLSNLTPENTQKNKHMRKKLRQNVIITQKIESKSCQLLLIFHGGFTFQQACQTSITVYNLYTC